MKNSIFAIFLLLSVAAQAQYKVSFVKPSVNGSKFRITLKMSAENAAFNLGANNLRFNYSTTDLANPVIVSEQFSNIAFGETTLTGSNPKSGIVTVNTAFKRNGYERGLEINKEGVELVTIEFDILNSNEQSPLTWRLDQSFPRTVALTDETEAIKPVSGKTFDANLKKPTINTNSIHTSSLLSIAPNPTSGIVNLSFDANQSGSVEINVVDVLGKIIKQQTTLATVGINKFNMDISDFPNGTYFITLKDKTTNNTQKIVKQ